MHSYQNLKLPTNWMLDSGIMSKVHDLKNIKNLSSYWNNHFHTTYNFHFKPFTDKASFYESCQDVHEKGENGAGFSS